MRSVAAALEEEKPLTIELGLLGALAETVPATLKRCSEHLKNKDVSDRVERMDRIKQSADGLLETATSFRKRVDSVQSEVQAKIDSAREQIRS
jgi:hypothetical protein